MTGWFQYRPGQVRAQKGSQIEWDTDLWMAGPVKERAAPGKAPAIWFQIAATLIW